ncbi:MAG: DUF5050 domain-containing protein [Lachnospiraceae bacterium]|nr:DUF5050 domain-containing protein [Lachnospiraceae bacterium]
MKNHGKLLIIPLMLVLAAFIAFAVHTYLESKVTMNDDSVIGNTAGNINNDGLFCESDGVVYFSNPADLNTLYSMQPDESDLRKLSSLSVKNILCGGNFLYYYMDINPNDQKASGLGSAVREYGIYRCKNNGKYEICVARENTDQFQLCGSYLYFGQGDEHKGTLERLRIDKQDRSTVLHEKINPSCMADGSLYFAEIKGDHSLKVLKTNAQNQVETVANLNAYQPQIMGNCLYYLDLSNHYYLCSYDLRSGQKQTLTSMPIDVYNLNGNTVFFDSQTTDNPGLYRMSLSDKTPVQIAPGAYHALNLTSQYLYCKAFGSDTVYHYALNGGQALTPFLPEMDQGKN